LRKSKIFPIIQEELPASCDGLKDVLVGTIASCDAVICLVGKVFGAQPTNQIGPRRSYTQMEYFTARELGKPTFIFLTHDSFLAPNQAEEPEEWRISQEVQRSRLLDTHKCEWFTCVDDLRLQVSQLVPSLLDLVVQPVHYLHPPERPAFFVGRRFEFEQLDAGLRTSSPSILMVIGMGGQGKTTLVSEFLRTRPGLGFGAGFWCTAYRASFTFDMFLDETLRYLSRGAFVKQNYQDTHARILALLEQLQARRVLLVVDGIERWLLGWMQGDTIAALPPSADQRASGQDGLDDFLRQVSGLTNGTHLILTTRAIPSALDRVSVALVPVYSDRQESRLRGMEPADAVEFLRRQGVKGTDTQLAAIGARWNCHPLALAVFSGLILKRYGGNVERMPALNVLDPRLPLNSLLNEARHHLPDAVLSDRIMMAASLVEENPTIRLIQAGLQILLPDQLIAEDRLVDNAIALAEWQLLDWDGELDTVAIHPLIREYFGALLSASQQKALHTTFAEFYASEDLKASPSSLADVRTRILAIIHHCHAENAVAAESLLFGEFHQGISFLDWLAGSGHLVTGIDLLGRLIALSADSQKARLLSVRGGLRTELRDFGKAIVDLDEAVRMHGERSDSSKPEAVFDLVGALINRGNAKREQSDKSSLADFDLALSTLTGISGFGWMLTLDWNLAQVRLNRSNDLSDRGRLTEAVSDINVSVQKLRAFAKQNPDFIGPLLAMSISNRGLLHMDLGNYKEAINDLDESCRVHASLAEQGRMDLRAKYAQVRATHGVVLDVAGKGVEALACFDESITDLQQLAEAGRHDAELSLAQALMNRGYARLNQNAIGPAIQDEERALSIFRRRAADDRRAKGFFAHTLLNLAEAHFRQGRRAESLEQQQQGQALFQELASNGVPCQAILLRKTVRAAVQWLQADLDVACRLLACAKDLLADTIIKTNMSEGLAIEAIRAWKQVEPAKGQFNASAAGREALSRFSDMVRKYQAID
jgi:tetratricopeptide (TPR) repeat protein